MTRITVGVFVLLCSASPLLAQVAAFEERRPGDWKSPCHVDPARIRSGRVDGPTLENRLYTERLRMREQHRKILLEMPGGFPRATVLRIGTENLGKCIVVLGVTRTPDPYVNTADAWLLSPDELVFAAWFYTDSAGGAYTRDRRDERLLLRRWTQCRRGLQVVVVGEFGGVDRYRRTHRRVDRQTGRDIGDAGAVVGDGDYWVKLDKAQLLFIEMPHDTTQELPLANAKLLVESYRKENDLSFSPCLPASSADPDIAQHMANKARADSADSARTRARAQYTADSVASALQHDAAVARLDSTISRCAKSRPPAGSRALSALGSILVGSEENKTACSETTTSALLTAKEQLVEGCRVGLAGWANDSACRTRVYGRLELLTELVRLETTRPKGWKEQRDDLAIKLSTPP
jgi:hypothetical protein